MTRNLRLLITLITLLWCHQATAFHDHGVASCSGCHTMHEDGITIISEPLLRGSDITSLCLSCHASEFGAVFSSTPLAPSPEVGGGNFIFLLEDNINDAPDGVSSPIPGHAAGHSVVSAELGLEPDLINNTSPGGNYPSNKLTCTSCHDPHGNKSFRMLRGREREHRTGFQFNFAAPQADGLNVETGIEAQNSHTAYKSGWANWCANCHGMYHQGGGASGFGHPANRSLGGNERSSYNTYNGPTDPNGGTYQTAYRPEVPIEDATMTVTATTGALSSSRVQCMTCHRAHATSAPDALRWDPNIATLDLDGVVSGSYPLPNPYPDPGQRALCVKCHYRESTDHGQGQACLDCHRNIN